MASTVRIDQFLGIGNAQDGNLISAGYAQYAMNVDIVKGALRNFAGTSAGTNFALPRGGRIIPYTLNGDRFLCAFNKYRAITSFDGYTALVCGAEKSVVSSDSNFNNSISGTSDMRGYASAKIDTDDVALVAFGKYGIYKYTKVYNAATQENDIHAEPFGTGRYMGVGAVASVQLTDGVMTSITIADTGTIFTDAVITRAVTDGIFLFNGESDDVNDAYLWLAVTGVENDGSNSIISVTAVSSAHTVAVGDTLRVRGGDSRVGVEQLAVFMSRLFASGTDAQIGAEETHPLRLYWSCLKGDGRTIEDWTQTTASIDTSGGHVEIGVPEDKKITHLFVMGDQLIIFTEKNLYRLYGYAPSNFTVELVCPMTYSMISEPCNVNGTPYWATHSGIAYFNGSTVTVIDDGGNLANTIAKEESDADIFSSNTKRMSVFHNGKMYFIAKERTTDSLCLFRVDLSEGTLLLYKGLYSSRMFVLDNTLFESHTYKESTISPYFPYVTANIWGNTEDTYDGTFAESVLQDGADATQFVAMNASYYGQVLDLQSLSTVKKPLKALMRGSGRLTLSVENDVGGEDIPITMPSSEFKVKECVAPKVGAGRTFQYRIASDAPFEIKAGLTFVFEGDSRR